MPQDLERAAATILKEAEIAPATTAVIAVSGGPDSLALLHVAASYFRPNRLWVAHLNHQLRPEAAGEAAYVKDIAAAWDLPFHGRDVDVTELARENGWSIEEAGRNARYQFLAETAAEMQARVVLVAHNADDQVETVLQHILRGSGLRGLQGMRPDGPLPGHEDIRLLRPFLTTSRAAIERYCRLHDLQPMWDATNEDTAYFRNRLRHELLPILQDFNPQVGQHLRQLADIVAAEEAYLAEETERAWQELLAEQHPRWLRLDRDRWRALPLSLRRRTLRRGLRELQPQVTEVSFQAVELAHEVAFARQTGAAAPLPGAVTLHVEYDHLRLALDAPPFPASQPQLPGDDPLILPVPGSVALAGGWQLAASEAAVDLAAVRANPDPWSAYLDIGQAAALQVRARRPGERMQPLGLAGRSASLQDIMVNRKLPAHLRDRWPLLATADHPLWLVGLHVDERAKVTSHTRRIIHVRCHQ